MKDKEYSRREFIKCNFLAGIATTTGMGISSSVLANVMPQLHTQSLNDDEPIIDIHQHIHYSGRSDELLLAHQKAMGISKTILLPAGRSVISATTHYGISNGLEAEAGGNEACYKFAIDHSDEFTFGACEVPDLPETISEIKKYLELGAKVIGELKFGIACDAAPMQKIYKLWCDLHHGEKNSTPNRLKDLQTYLYNRLEGGLSILRL